MTHETHTLDHSSCVKCRPVECRTSCLSTSNRLHRGRFHRVLLFWASSQAKTRCLPPGRLLQGACARSGRSARRPHGRRRAGLLVMSRALKKSSTAGPSN
eukprot:1516482-Prymnesium_polylepis.1